ncbi:hypothetical protein, partial [Arthrobacter globiformis]|uniref:hypothetical protein n=1 Tax=Arthrobacter globiformis TaxID=1665 RepID=UPI001C0E9B0D
DPSTEGVLLLCLLGPRSFNLQDLRRANAGNAQSAEGWLRMLQRTGLRRISVANFFTELVKDQLPTLAQE